MSAEFQSIDDQIKASYQSASQVELRLVNLKPKSPRSMAQSIYNQHVVKVTGRHGKNQVKPHTYQPYCTRFRRASSLLRYRSCNPPPYRRGEREQSHGSAVVSDAPERLPDSSERATKVREQQLTYATQPKYSSSHGRERRKPEPMQWNGSGSSRSSWGELTSHTLLFREIERYL